MSNLERYIEDSGKQLLTGIESMLVGAAHQAHELHKNIDDLYFGGIDEENLTRAQRARAELHTPKTPAEIAEALQNPTDPFNEAEELYGKLADTGNDIDQSDYIIDEDDGDGDAYRYFNRF